jgi:hypothetical protein
MKVHTATSENLQETCQLCGTDYNSDQWQRWDEELVNGFGQWLIRMAKALTILLLMVFAGAIMGWV